MHAIKRSAHRSAWFSSQSDGVKTYNIFGRIDTRPRKFQDIENQLPHPATENEVISPVEDKRRSTAAAENSAFSGPHKSNTFPSQQQHQHLIVPGHSEEGAPAPAQREYDSEKPDLSLQTDSAPSGSIEQTVTSSSTTGGAHKRKSRRKFFDKITGKPGVPESNGAANEEIDDKKEQQRLTFMSQFKAVFFSPINILLVFVPVGIALNYTGVNKIVVFVINFIAIIPLAAMLSFSTEELALYIGEVLGGLLNATFGNAVELIVSIIALTQGQTLIVQTSLVGSMLSNLLLVLGMCMAAGGVRRSEQHFNITVAQTAASLLALAIGSLIIPTAFQIFEKQPGGVTQTSRGTAVILLVVYGCYLLFQLRTHVDLYNAPSQKTPKTGGRKEAGEAKKGIAAIAGTGAAMAGGQINQENLVQEQDDTEKAQLTIIGALATLAISTVFIALCAEYMVSSINYVSQHVSQEFIGLILLPIVGNAAEHATAVTVAIKDKMDLSIGVAVGSSLQIALLVLPIMIMLNWWGVGSPKDLTLDFDGFQVSVLFIAIIIVNYVVQDGKSNWLEGVMLQATYLIIAVSAWFYPAPGEVAG